MPDSAHDERFLRSSVAAVIAHPDDETISMSAQLAKFRNSITVIQVTDGSPRDLKWAHEAGCQTREEYADKRRLELLTALHLAGISPMQCPALGYADQEASFHLAELSRTLCSRLLQLQPKFVFTHPYEGGHPDHDACSFAVRAAVTLMEREGAMPPAILEFTSYHQAKQGEGRPRVFEFLNNSSNPVTTIDLTEEQRSLKLQMYQCHITQQRVLSLFPIGVEKFRTAPAYDYSQRAHEGELYYESHRWAIDGNRFCLMAKEALEELALPVA